MGRFEKLILTPAGLDSVVLAIAGSRAGGIGVVNHELGSDRGQWMQDLAQVAAGAGYGETNIENAALLCYFHHRLIHEGRWTIKIDADATIKWFKPDGTHYNTSYPRPPTPPIPTNE